MLIILHFTKYNTYLHHLKVAPPNPSFNYTERLLIPSFYKIYQMHSKSYVKYLRIVQN